MAKLYKLIVKYIPDELNRPTETDEPYVDYQIRVFTARTTPKLVKYRDVGIGHLKKSDLKKVLEGSSGSIRVLYLLDPNNEDVIKYLGILRGHMVGLIRSRLTYLEKALKATRLLNIENFREKLDESIS